MMMYLFVQNFLNRLRAVQYNPVVPANANLVYFPILLGPFT